MLNNDDLQWIHNSSESLKSVCESLDSIFMMCDRDGIKDINLNKLLKHTLVSKFEGIIHPLETQVLIEALKQITSKFQNNSKRVGRRPMPKHLRKNKISLCLPQWLIEWTSDRPESRAVLIEQALRQVHNIKPNVL